MIAAVSILLAAVLGGTLATYLYEARAGFAYRLASGACIGLTALALVGYVTATWLGMGPVALVIATVLTVGAPAAVPGTLAGMIRDVKGLRRRRIAWSRLAAVAVVAVLLWLCYERAMIVRNDGIFTGYIDNYADLTLHLGIITGFVHGQNFPPEHPEYAGTRLAYPFLADFGAAMLVTAGAPIEQAMFMQSVLLTLSIVIVLYVWGRRLTGDRSAAFLVPVLVFLNGGLGFLMLRDELRTAPLGAWQYLTHLPHDYTAHEDRYRWANALVYWFVPMRSMLLGVPLFVIVTGLWWKALGHEVPDPVLPPSDRKPEKRSRGKEPAPDPPGFAPERTMIGAGVIAGLLLLAHAHTCVTLLVMGILLMLITRRWRLWILFGAVAAILAIPQGLWAISGSSVQAEKFREWYPGWSGHDRAVAQVAAWLPGPEEGAPLVMRVERNLLFGVAAAWYWFLNTGLFIPLLLAALAWRGRRPVVPRPLLLFYAPFALCFVVPNLVRLAPWEWDNIKVLIYWFIPSVPLVALLLVRVWRASPAGRGFAAIAIFVLTLSGALDIWRVLTHALEWRDFSPSEVALGELIRTRTPPRAVLLNAALHNHPFLLSGRRSFFGYPGTLWTHGIVYAERESDMKKIYEGGPEALELIQKDKIDYVVIGPMERDNVKPLNEAFFAQFPRAGETSDAVLYKVR